MKKTVITFAHAGLPLLLGLLPFVVSAQVELQVLGSMQDAGLPQLGCAKSCCVQAGKPRERVPVVVLGITQSDPKQGVLIEATPDIGSQWQRFMLINHTNPLLQEGSVALKNLAAFGFQLSRVGDSIQL